MFAFFVCLFLLVSSGRLGSIDAGNQLEAAMLLATTGTLGTTYSAETAGWVPSPNGRVYEAHDVGALALMWPSAWLAAKTSHASPDALFRNPPLLAKVGTTLTYAIVCAIGCTFLFLFFASFYPPTASFLLTLLLALGTFFIAYAKMAWDVAPAAAMMCIFLYYLQATLRTGATMRTFACAGIALALLCSFRYSLAPFMAVTLAWIAWPNRTQWPKYLVLGLTFLIGMAPTFVYNAVRTGSPLRPATATDFYLKGNNSLDGNIVDGALGLLFSGNHGVVFYAPPLLLILALPFVWRSLPPVLRTVVAATMIGSLLYFVLIAKMVNWGTFGWGPRYLLPVLPVWFIAAAPVLMSLWNRLPAAVLVVALASIGLNIAPVMANWNVVAAEYPGAQDAKSAYPYSIEGIWTGLAQGLRGEAIHFELSDPKAATEDAARRFPDIWTARLAETSVKGRIAGVAMVVALLCGMMWSLKRMLGAGLCRRSGCRAAPSSLPPTLLPPDLLLPVPLRRAPLPRISVLRVPRLPSPRRDVPSAPSRRVLLMSQR